MVLRWSRTRRAAGAGCTAALVAWAVGFAAALPASASAAASPKPGTAGLLASGLKNSSGTAMCLDDYKNGTAVGSRVLLYPCNKTDKAQQWTPYSDHTIRIHGKCATAVGTVNGSQLQLRNCADSTNQVWSTGTNPKVSLNNLTEKATGKCLDVFSSKTANNSTIDIWSCDDTNAQVWGWVTGSAAIAPGGNMANANCDYVGGFNEPNDGGCYAWVGASQQDNNSFSATGVSADFKQGNPVCTGGCGHSLVEMYVADATGKNVIEYGWGVAAGATQPTLGIGLWANGDPLDAVGNFVQVSTTVKIGQQVTVGATGAYEISFDSSTQEWQLFYNSVEVGYFPQTIWTSRGTSYTAVGFDEMFGEVVQPALTVAHMQMGNGVLGSLTGAVSVSNYQLLDSSTPGDFSSYFVDAKAQYYDDGDTTSTGFSYGGPGIFGASAGPSAGPSRSSARRSAGHRQAHPPVGAMRF